MGKIVDECARAGDVAATAAQCLAERAHPDIDLARVDAGVFGDTETALTEHAEGMGFVDHEGGSPAAGNGDETSQVGYIAVHAVVALDHQKRPLGAGTCGG